MPDSPPVPGTGWSVISQVTKISPNAAGALVPGMEITFQTSSGQTGTVFVPQVVYTVDKAREMIAAQVLVMDQVQALKG